MAPRENDSIGPIKLAAFDWIFKGLIAVVCWLVLDMHGDLKSVMQVIPALKVEIDNLKDKRLIESLRRFEVPDAKHEDLITYDTLKKYMP